MSAPIGPYRPIVRAGDLLFVSGQLGVVDGELVAGGVAAQTAQLIRNMAALLESEGASLASVVKTTCFLTDMDDFQTFNTAYVEALGQHRPARSTFAVKGLPMGAAVEVEAVAYHPA